MKKDFPENKLKAMSEEKQLRVLYELASFIEENTCALSSAHFERLVKYHQFLLESQHDKILKLNKEFHKIKKLDFQFQVYLLNLERFLGQSKKEYDFLVNTGDQESSNRIFPVICLLDSVRSAHNVGAMFRNAECFGCTEIILCGLSPTPDLQQVKKTAMGCDQAISWSYSKSAVEKVKELKESGHNIWSVETSNNAIKAHKINKTETPIVLIFGHELHGISHELLELSDEIISIDLYGKKNSLNVSVSQAVILHQITSLLV